MKPRVYYPLFNLLPWLVLIWITATWYGETQLERFEISGSGTNQLAEGDFTEGLPKAPEWEFAVPADGLWQPAGGVDDGAALRLKAEDGGFARYRLPVVGLVDGYSIGLCLRLAGAASDTPPATAELRLVHAGSMRVGLPARDLVTASSDGAWSCGMDAVIIPVGIDELVLEVDAPETGELWIDRVVLYPAFSSADYDLVHALLVAGWLTFGAMALVLTWYLLGLAGGLMVVVPAVGLAGYVLFVSGIYSLPPAVEQVLGLVLPVVAEGVDYVLDLVRVLMGGTAGGGRWLDTSAVDGISVLALLVLGLLTAVVAGMRFRWALHRPWRWVLFTGVLYALALQALRLLVHAPGYAAVQWIIDPLAMFAGMVLGLALIEPVTALYCRFAKPPIPEQDSDPW